MRWLWKQRVRSNSLSKTVSDGPATCRQAFCHTIRGSGKKIWDTLTYVKPETANETQADTFGDVEE